MTETASVSTTMPIRWDDGPYSRARLGFVCVANAGLTEGEMFSMCPAGVGLSFTRVTMAESCTVDNLAAMEEHLDQALTAFMPARDDMNVLCYNCTSGSFVIGEEVIREKLESARPGTRGTTMLTGVVAALRAFGARTISLGTAYTSDLNELERAYLEERGFHCAAIAGLDLRTDAQMNRVAPSFLHEFALSLDRPETDVIFLSCGALRSLEIIQDVEREIGKPVICSNQASFWHCLRLAGIEDRIEGFGQLFQRL